MAIRKPRTPASGQHPTGAPDPHRAHAYHPVAHNWFDHGVTSIQSQGSETGKWQGIAAAGHFAQRQCACGKAWDDEVHFAVRDGE
jgi:hypothetical protein